MLALQDVAIAQIIDVMRKSVKEEPRTLFVVGAYHIGKERAFLGAAKALQWPVWVNPDKLRVSMIDTRHASTFASRNLAS